MRLLLVALQLATLALAFQRLPTPPRPAVAVGTAGPACAAAPRRSLVPAAVASEAAGVGGAEVDGGGGGGDTYEVVLAKPLGMQLAEEEEGVTVSMLYEGGNAAAKGVQVGDVVLATSASIGSQMWEKRTLAGVESAIRTRVDGQVRLRLRRARKRPPPWSAPLVCTYEVELSRPLGLALRQRPTSSEGAAPAVEVAEVVPDSSAADDGRIEPGDLVLATSASVGDQMWQKSSLEGVTAAISTRLALCPTVRLRLQRTERLGPWAAELAEVHGGERRRLSPGALRSLRRLRRQRRAQAQGGAPLQEEVQAALRYLAAESVRKVRAPAVRGEPVRGARQLVRLPARLRGAGVALDARLCTQLMSAALRAGMPRVALAAVEQLLRDGGAPDAQVYTTLVKAHDACGQRAEALAVLPRMKAEQVAPTVQTFNTLMAVCSRASDREAMLRYFGMLQQAGLRPTVTSFNVLLAYCARRAEPAQATALLDKMRKVGVAPDVVSYSSAVQACVGRGDMAEAAALLLQLRADGLSPDTTLLNTLLGGHATQMQWAAAFELLEEAIAEGVAPDPLSFSLLIRACSRAKAAEPAERALRLMAESGLPPTPRTYAMVMSARAVPGGLQAVLRLLREMQSAGLEPDKFAFSALLEACVVNNQAKTALAVFDQMVEQGVEPDLVTHTLKLRALCSLPSRKADGLRNATALLDEMAAAGGDHAPNVVSFNTVLGGHVQAADAAAALAVLRRLLETPAASPNRNTYELIASYGAEPRRGWRGAKRAAAATAAAAAAEVATAAEPRQRLATFRFLSDVLDLFEARGRRLTGAVYLALLRACEAEPEAAQRLISRRRSFELRRADQAEADQLEEQLLRRTPAEQGLASSPALG